jgi:hypothetical protein
MFLELTQKTTEARLLIAVDRIDAVAREDEGCIVQVNGGTLHVNQAYVTVRQMLGVEGRLIVTPHDIR